MIKMVLVEKIERKRTGETEVYKHKLIQNTSKEFWCPDLGFKVDIETMTTSSGRPIGEPFASSSIRTITYTIEE
jgi:hypothetical protein